MLNSPESIKCSVSGRMKTAITDHESGEVICSCCGTVISEKILDLGNPEWRAFTTEESENKARTGIPISLSQHDMGLATIIGRPNKDASGKRLDTNTRTTFKRLRNWDSRTQIYSSQNRNFRKAFTDLNMLKDKLGLSDSIVEKTAYLYRKVEDSGLVKGRAISGMLAACVYVACRQCDTPRTLKDVAAKSNITRKVIARNCRSVIQGLNMTTPVFDPMKCIIKVASAALVSERTKRQAFIMMNELLRRKTLTAGKDPMWLAASILYIACNDTGENNTQKNLAKAAGVTEVTIRNRIRDLGRDVSIISANLLSRNSLPKNAPFGI
jgi:transcription initiation factor TFIIB